ncbi:MULTISPECIES: alpha/beta hydrolase [Dietzia]|uniref:Acyl-CoA:diacylglycerol acyltransferase n=1 Tax=Dietzia cinnamea TaxID=321318 RepID=A0AAW5Q207_9ACTN|nr:MULTISPECIES: alpha/beta hydrolase family protein [Dietzia]MBC7306317.1 esterase family protein [Dietzia sp.]AVM63578.1 mycolyltransferase [Dietzia sp. oral taxon 368]MCT1862759.1 esterase family protein [Dietzia cinnamea]MCT2029731.1 esterase family protein [Dietzia cinnamea]MCT2032036.1 esterase family protein [Dietzia cinnamea]
MRSVKSRRLGTKVTAAALAAAMVPVVATGTAQAQGGTIQYTKATATNKVAETELPDGRLIVSVWSDKMAIEVPNIVQRPRDGNPHAPVLYLVNGAGGGEDSATWQAQSDVKQFMSDKDAWTVTPIGGAFSYYTDWQKHDPNVQTRFARDTDRPMAFETYLAKELPDLFEGRYGGNTGDARGRGLAAISMTATSVLTIAQKYPGRFDAIGSYSGCAETSTPIGHEFINIVTGMRGGADLNNMWGPFPGEPRAGTNSWFDNDPVWGAWRFKEQMDRGQLPAMFISTGNGLPGPHESLENWRLRNSIPALANQAIVGGVIEAATQYCTANLARRFGELGIPAHFDFAPNGTHSWGYWEDDLKQSWPMMANAMGARWGAL